MTFCVTDTFLLRRVGVCGEMKTKQFANIITTFRILGTIVLLFFPLFSSEFYITYLLCGFSDMIDGAVARKTNSATTFGAKLDTVADLIFMIGVCCKLLPAIHLPQWLWIWVMIIALLKLSNIIWGVHRRKSLIALHSTLNKVTGLALFLLPLTIQIVELKYSLPPICLLATFAAIQEGNYIRKGREII